MRYFVKQNENSLKVFGYIFLAKRPRIEGKSVAFSVFLADFFDFFF